MCVVAIAMGISERYPFALIHNRDEFYGRTFTPLSLYKNGIAGGRDNRAGGLWLGMRGSRLAFVLNFRRGIPVKVRSLRSRGELVENYLAGEQTPDAFLSDLPVHKYGPFNLFLGDTNTLRGFSSPDCLELEVGRGIHAFSNGPLNEEWPKAARAKRGMKGMLLSGLREEKLVKSLFDLLTDSEPAPPETLPNTGIPPERELQLSSIFVKSPDYGTVASTVILRDAMGQTRIWERENDYQGWYTVRNLNL